MPIFGRSWLSAPLSLAAGRGELRFSLRKLICRPLDPWTLEPILRRKLPPQGGADQDHKHREQRVVEVGLKVGGKRGRQYKEDRDEDDPDDRNPSYDRAPPTQVPWTLLEALALQAPKQDGDAVRHVKPDGRDRCD